MEFFKSKVGYISENPESLKAEKTKEEWLILAENYTDAEAQIHELISYFQLTNISPNVNYEILKTKINEVLLTDAFDIDREYKNDRVIYGFDLNTENAVFEIEASFENEQEDGSIKIKAQKFYIGAETSTSSIALAEKFIKKMDGRTFKITGCKKTAFKSVVLSVGKHEGQKEFALSAGILTAA